MQAHDFKIGFDFKKINIGEYRSDLTELTLASLTLYQLYIVKKYSRS